MARTHLAPEYEVRGQQAAYLYFDKHPEMDRKLLLEIARGARHCALMSNDNNKVEWADGFCNILSALAFLRK